MKGTPIRIRGKNTCDRSKAAVAARKALKRQPGRPLKLTTGTNSVESSDVSAEVMKEPQKRSFKHIKSRRKMSLLEKLPTELLVEIFIHCMNLDLPRSSPVIAAKLTSVLVYTRTVLEVFGPTWEKGFGRFKWMVEVECSSQEKELTRDLGVSGRGDGDAELQSAVLRCRWASLSILQTSQEIWIGRYCKDRIFKPLPFLVHRDLGEERRLQRKRIERKTSPAQFFAEDFAAFSACILSPDQALTATQDWNSYTDVAEDLEIPRSLLLGPWNEEAIKMLFWLVKGGARLHWLNSTSGEVAEVGFKSAIVDGGDLRAIHLLFWAGLYSQLGADGIIWVIRNTNPSRINVVRMVISLWTGTDTGLLLVDAALREMRGKAKEDDDHETLDFVELVQEHIKKQEDDW